MIRFPTLFAFGIVALGAAFVGAESTRVEGPAMVADLPAFANAPARKQVRLIAPRLQQAQQPAATTAAVSERELLKR